MLLNFMDFVSVKKNFIFNFIEASKNCKNLKKYEYMTPLKDVIK